MARRKRKRAANEGFVTRIKRTIAMYRRARWRRNAFAAWLERHPGGSYAQFYAENARDGLAEGKPHPTLGVKNVDEATVRARANKILEDFKRAGGMPHHVVVDYGCGSLWVGEAFMEYLDPGNYIGLDVVDFFYKDGLARLPADFVASRRPSLHVISDASLADVRARNPDFVFSFAVMMHVPPGDLGGYFARILSLAGPRTRIDIDNRVTLFCTWGRQPNLKWHTRGSVRRALAPLGCTADFRIERRIIPSTPGFVVVPR